MVDVFEEEDTYTDGESLAEMCDTFVEDMIQKVFGNLEHDALVAAEDALLCTLLYISPTSHLPPVSTL